MRTYRLHGCTRRQVHAKTSQEAVLCSQREWPPEKPNLLTPLDIQPANGHRFLLFKPPSQWYSDRLSLANTYTDAQEGLHEDLLLDCHIYIVAQW